MLLQTNSYIVPKEKRAEHSRLIRRFRQTLLRLGCDHFEVYEQVGSNWSNSESNGRYVQILRFLDRKHQLAVQAAERVDPTAQAVIADFCELINFPYQQQQGLFAVGFYTSVLPIAPKRGARGELISTVEHEVIDDPEAEQPYDDASDAIPPQPNLVDEAVSAETVEAVEASEHEPVDAVEAFISETPATEHSTEPSADSSPIPEQPIEESHSDKTNDDFMDLVSGEIDGDAAGEETAASPFEEDRPSGFIDAEPLDETTAAAHRAKDQPSGW